MKPDPPAVTDVERSEEPNDRLTRICDAMSEAYSAHPEASEGDKILVLLTGPVDGGLVTIGYESDAEAINDLVMHLQAIFNANGIDMKIGTPDSFAATRRPRRR